MKKFSSNLLKTSKREKISKCFGTFGTLEEENLDDLRKNLKNIFSLSKFEIYPKIQIQSTFFQILPHLGIFSDFLISKR